MYLLLSEITVSEFFKIITDVYDEEKSALLDSQRNPNQINYVVGKIMVKSKGKIDPKLAMKITQCIVESDLPNNRKMDITHNE